LIFADTILGLDFFHHTEKVTNRVAVTTNLELPSIAIVLNNISLLELRLDKFHQFVSSRFSHVPSMEFVSPDGLASLLEIIEVRADSIWSKLLGQDCISQVGHIGLQVKDGERLRNIGCLNLMLELLFFHGLYFEFDLVASTKLVLDMGCWSKAFEFTFDHNSHLCAKSLSLFHGMCSDHYGTLLSLS